MSKLAQSANERLKSSKNNSVIPMRTFTSMIKGNNLSLLPGEEHQLINKRGKKHSIGSLTNLQLDTNWQMQLQIFLKRFLQQILPQLHASLEDEQHELDSVESLIEYLELSSKCEKIFFFKYTAV